MKVKPGDIIEFAGLRWDDQWEFDYPSVILDPVFKYSSCGEPPEAIIEDLCLNLCIESEQDRNYNPVMSEGEKMEFDWRRWKVGTMKKVIKDRLNDGTMWKSKFATAVKLKVEFYQEGDTIEFRVLETIKK